MTTIADALRSTAARVPDREALVFEESRLTYRELDAQVDRVAAVLLESGLTKGDRLALMSTNTDRFVIAFYAAHRVGAVVVPVNPASAVPELDYLIRDSGAAALIFDPTLLPAVGQAVEDGLPEGLRIFSTYTTDGVLDLFALAAEQPGGPVEVEVAESDNAQILYTSGTTGHPKGALFDHHRAMWESLACIATVGLKDGDRLLHVAPLYHAAELNIMLVPGTVIGATHIIHNGFDPAKVLTMFFGVPTMFQFLLRLPDLASRDLSAWRTGMYGAAPMPTTAVQQLVAAFPSVEFMNLCGQTEAGPGGIFLNRQQVLARPDASGRQALVTMEVRVVDPDGPTMMKGYWNKPEATAETLRDGWVHTGDLTRLDADGYMTLVDRLKDMIITGGRNVYSIEVENAIAAHPAVLDCAVVSRPHADYGESIVAIATLKEGAALDLAELRAFCAERITRYKLPHELIVVDAVPRNPSGKILKQVLRDEFLSTVL
jgi:acyl-CoA synthetase (AMP-forming)/AMP-acid ligase II